MTLTASMDGNPGPVMIAGLPGDRAPADVVADQRELEGLLEGLGLDVIKSDPGRDAGDFAAAGQVPGVIIALPHGARALSIQAGRVGASLVRTGLPMGIEGTCRWIREVAAATGREAGAEAWIRECLDRVMPRLEWVVPHALLHRKVAFDGDGITAQAFKAFVEELGMSVVQTRLTDDPDGPGKSSGVALGELDPRPDLFVGGRTGFTEAMSAGIPALEDGLPGGGRGVVIGTPRLGFAGALAMVEAMMNRMKLWEYLNARMDLLNRPMPR